MRRTRHPAVRLLAALTALVTVWCLGCSAFDPLVEHLLGSASGMVCASESGAVMSGDMHAERTSTSSSVSVTQQDRGPATVSAAQDHGASGVSCGCQSCNAASPVSLFAAAPAVAAPPAYLWTVACLLELERAPLVPPPQFAL